MNYLQLRNDNITEFFDSSEIVMETVQQIMKDFALFGLSITFSGKIETAYNELHEQLIQQITGLLDNDYGRLLSVLYQVDISDKEIARAHIKLPHYNQVEVIAHQIIVRDLKKVLTKRYFKMNPL